MRVVFSDKFHELLEIVKPYVNAYTAELDPNAPEDIKRAYKEFMKLGDKEYEEAFPE